MTPLRINRQGVVERPKVTWQGCGRLSPQAPPGSRGSRTEWRKLGSWLGWGSMWNTNVMRASGCNPPSFRRPSHLWWPRAVVSMKSWVIGQAQYWPQSKQSLPPGWTGWEEVKLEPGSTGRQQMGAGRGWWMCSRPNRDQLQGHFCYGGDGGHQARCPRG